MSFPIAHWPDAHFPNAHWPHEPRLQGGGGGRKKFKSWDQRERERQEQLRKDADARRARENKDRFGDMPKALEEVLAQTSTEYKRLDPQAVRAYQKAQDRALAGVEHNDDEEAMALILALL